MKSLLFIKLALFIPMLIIMISNASMWHLEDDNNKTTKDGNNTSYSLTTPRPTQIFGPSLGIVNTKYEFCIYSQSNGTSSEKVHYIITWGDSEQSQLGTKNCELHAWGKPGTYWVSGDSFIIWDGAPTFIVSSYPISITIKEAIPELTVENGEKFFEPEPGEQAIPGPVFLRGVVWPHGPGFNAIVPGGADSVKVDIIGPNGGKLETINLAKSAEDCFTGVWNWGHYGWETDQDIPVGEYKAVFQVANKDRNITSERIFYVIFNPAEVDAPDEFSISEKGEKGIWFGTVNGGDFALTYTLHPDDNRVFGRAIKEINGETSQENAAKKLLKLENGMFEYDEGWHGQDIIYLIEHETKAQCADDANMLVSLLRSTGIPAHTTTADAAVEQGVMNWNFDTWAEARFKGVSGDQWYSLHPHVGLGLGPVTVDVAGTNWNVATKRNNDVIIIAKENWVPGEVSDEVNDTEFKYDTPCKEPNQNFEKIASWIDHLCMPGPSGIGYWGIGHWTCSRESLNHTSNLTVALDNLENKSHYDVGDMMLINIALANPTRENASYEVRADVFVDDPRTMLFPDEVLNISTESISINSNETRTINLNYELPGSLSSFNTYFVDVNVTGDDSRTPFAVNPLFKSRLALPDRVEEGDNFVAELTIANPQEMPLKDIYAKLDLPFEVQSSENVLSKRIENLEPGSEATLTWNLTAKSRTIVAPLVFTISSQTCGGAKISKGLEIQHGIN